MIGLMEMTSPMWEWLLAPLGLIGIGFFLGTLYERWCHDDRLLLDAMCPDEDTYPISHVRVIPEKKAPYDWEQEGEQ